ncbi:MAG: metallophosphoesterase [Oscillospiraceae bacterium]|nr:metallophosphoesterase [Oscillospiraceae bacterium]
MAWLIILVAVLATTALGLAYCVACVGRFALVRELSGGKKWRGRLISLGIVAAVFAALALLLSTVNAIVVSLHVVLFLLLFGLGTRIWERVTGRRSRIYWQGWLALGFSVVYLTAGYVLCRHVWQKDYHLQTDKELGTLKIALIADSHIGTTFDGEGFVQELRRIEEQSPDMLVIAGDFVDDATSRADMLRACEGLGELRLPRGVWYVYGNHDGGYYSSRDFTAEELEAALRQNGVHVLKDEAAPAGDAVYVVGRQDASHRDRTDMEELLAGLGTDRYIIVLDHQPNDYEDESRSAADLVLSGHSHGGQLIPITYVGQWAGMLDRTYGHENRRGTDFIVTSGISDWELLFKTGMRSEYVIVTVEGRTPAEAADAAA